MRVTSDKMALHAFALLTKQGGRPRWRISRTTCLQQARQETRKSRAPPRCRTPRRHLLFSGTDIDVAISPGRTKPQRHFRHVTTPSCWGPFGSVAVIDGGVRLADFITAVFPTFCSCPRSLVCTRLLCVGGAIRFSKFRSCFTDDVWVLRSERFTGSSFSFMSHILFLCRTQRGKKKRGYS